MAKIRRQNVARTTAATRLSSLSSCCCMFFLLLIVINVSFIATVEAFSTTPTTTAWTRPFLSTSSPAPFMVGKGRCQRRLQQTRRSGYLVLFQSSIGIESGGAGSSSSSVVAAASSTDDVTAVTTSDRTGVPPAAPEPQQQQPSDLQTSDMTTKILNGLLLACSFGFAAYTILNIDGGMTRGWTQTEIAMRIPLDNWLNYENALATSPIFTKTTINVIIYLLGDWLSQTIFSGNHILDFDASRTLRNGLIGLCFGPLVHEYYQFSDYILPVEGGMWNRLEKIAMDQTLYLTIKCSIYIAAVGLLNGENVKTVKTNVQEKLPNIVLTAWKFWPLVHLVTYGLIPARHRILWVNCVDLVWNAILASMSQKEQGAGADETTDSNSMIPGQEEPEIILLTEDIEVPPVTSSNIANNEVLLQSTSSFAADNKAASDVVVAAPPASEQQHIITDDPVLLDDEDDAIILDNGAEEISFFNETTADEHADPFLLDQDVIVEVVESNKKSLLFNNDTSSTSVSVEDDSLVVK